MCCTSCAPQARFYLHQARISMLASFQLIAGLSDKVFGCATADGVPGMPQLMCQAAPADFF